MRSRTWFLLSAMLFLASVVFWRMGNERVAQRAVVRPAATNDSAPASKTQATNLSLLTPSVSPNLVAGTLSPSGAPITPATKEGTNRFPYRLRNTELSVDALGRTESGLLLANALIDTATGQPVDIPAHLRAQGDPGSYIVQSRGPADRRFRNRLTAVGAEIISYIPNNAYLVRLDGASARALNGAAEVQAVLPYEPYYKLDATLLQAAVERDPSASPNRLALTLFAGEIESASAALQSLDAVTIAEWRSPFGPQLIVEVPGNRLAAIAVLPSVQYVEPVYERALMNDRSRVRTAVSTDTEVATSYLGLTGEGVIVNVNDSGVDARHPDLTARVSSDDTNSFTVLDPNGHGTHVAGTIAGSGSQSSTVTFADGSVSNASFRGMAPNAKIYALPVDLQTGPLISDAYLQERAAQAKTFVSNNSWGYPGDRSYNSFAASYDAAVRDALPGVSGSQPMLYVFAAGNSGQGTDSGLGGVPGSITSPATAKNVISVGSIEQFRNLTNHYVTNIITIEGDLSVTNTVTNYFFLAETDSDDEVSSFSSRGNVGIGLEGNGGRFKPDVVAPGAWVISTRATAWTDPDFFNNWEVVKQLNDGLSPHYRYQSGTSMSAPVVSGVLALMQEFFEQRMNRTNSPALMKALLINGARSIHSRYSFDPRAFVNYQGWGLVNISNSVPSALSEPAAESKWPIRFLDQDPTNTLATGQSRAWKFTLSPEAQQDGLRVTLVWTDPPGNPAAAIKLVNDLDLVVTNLDTGAVYYGNDIPFGEDFNTSHTGTSTIAVDFVNNVENVFLRGPLSSNYVVAVAARRVNVNAISQDTNNVVQDFALVVSSSNPQSANAFTVFEPQAGPVISRPVIPVTNGVVVLNQRVGANYPLTNATVGDLRQWNFYVFTNTFQQGGFATITNGTNVAFLTFLPPNLGRPRALDSDIDMYVSTNAAITNLDPVAISTAFQAVKRGGSQVIFFTNAPLDSVFYVGVKAEDQQGSEFALVGLSSEEPFSSLDANGNQNVRGLPLNVPIPDGSPEQPAQAFVFGIATIPMTIGRVYVTNYLTHESLGDLFGNLSHDSFFAVLNNHNSGTPGVTNYVFIYDDAQGGPYFDSSGNYITPTDGPGSLGDFIGGEAIGAWILTMVDNSQTHTGMVRRMDILIERGDFSELALSGTVQPNEFAYYYIDVPVDATNLTVTLSQMTGPLNLYIRRGALPTRAVYDKAAFLSPPGGFLSISTRDSPPLVGGRYFIAVYNPNAVTVNFRISVRIDRNLTIDSDQVFTSTDTPVAIRDDAISESSILVPVDREVIDLQVGVRIQHPRIADLVLHLVSPQGTRVLLSENRGHLSTEGYGSGSESNTAYFVFTENAIRSTTPVKFAPLPFGGAVSQPPIPISSFEGAPAGAYDAGDSFDGWTVVGVGAFTNKTTGVVTNTRPSLVASSVAHTGTQFLDLGGAYVARDIPTVVGQTYYLSFVYWAATNASVNATLILNGVRDRLLTQRPENWATYTKLFTATTSSTRLEIVSDRFSPGLYLDSFTLRESSAIYALPEDSLKEVNGEFATGLWRLEVWDNRAGAVAPAPEILSWQLQFILAPPRTPAIKLENGIPYNGTVVGTEIQYFVVEVPRSATFATNLLFSLGDLVLLYSPSGLPTGQFPEDVMVDSFGTNSVEFLILNTNRPPILNPGQRYYLGVANYNGNEVNDFVIRVDFDRTDSGIFGIIHLTNAIPYTNTIAVTNALDYYQFDVSSLATNVTFEVFPENGNVDLVVRKSLPVLDTLPTVGSFDYESSQAGTNAEIVVVDFDSFPVPLEPRAWYLGVYNRDSTNVTYRIVATEKTPPITPLTNAIPLRGRVVGTNAVEYFSFLVSNNATEATFQTFNADGNVDLLLRRGGPLPGGTNFHYLSANSGTNDEVIVVATDSAPVALAPGNWYLTVTNVDVLPVTYSIVASEIVPVGSVTIRSIYITNNTLCIEWDSTVGAEYLVQGKVRVDDPAWNPVSPRILATNVVTTYCVPLTIPEHYFQVIQISAPSTGVDPVIDLGSLTVRSNQLCLTWSSLVGTNYYVEGKATVDGPVWTVLSPTITATNTTTSYCLPITGLAQFVRVRQGVSPTAPTNVVNFEVTVVTAAAVTLQWTAAPNLRFRVEYASDPAGPWSAVPTPVTSATGNYTFTDDGTSTGGLPLVRFYRLVQLP